MCCITRQRLTIFTIYVTLIIEQEKVAGFYFKLKHDYINDKLTLSSKAMKTARLPCVEGVSENVLLSKAFFVAQRYRNVKMEAEQWFLTDINFRQIQISRK